MSILRDFQDILRTLKVFQYQLNFFPKYEPDDPGGFSGYSEGPQAF